MALADHITIDEIKSVVSWVLPVSKTDVQALGTTLAWGCTCIANPPASPFPCPYHDMVAQLEFLHRRFAVVGSLPFRLPLWPTESGEVPTKEKVIETVRELAGRLGEPTLDAEGSFKHGRHSRRVSGARTLSSLGMSLYKIESLTRWKATAWLRRRCRRITRAVSVSARTAPV